MRDGTIAEAFWNMCRFQRSADVQAALEGVPASECEIPVEIRERCVAVADHYGPLSLAEAIFLALLRMVRRFDLSLDHWRPVAWFEPRQLTSAIAMPSYPLLPTVWIAVALTRGSAASIS
jgi:hypothetical protein